MYLKLFVSVEPVWERVFLMNLQRCHVSGWNLTIAGAFTPQSLAKAIRQGLPFFQELIAKYPLARFSEVMLLHRRHECSCRCYVGKGIVNFVFWEVVLTLEQQMSLARLVVECLLSWSWHCFSTKTQRQKPSIVPMPAAAVPHPIFGLFSSYARYKFHAKSFFCLSAWRHKSKLAVFPYNIYYTFPCSSSSFHLLSCPMFLVLKMYPSAFYAFTAHDRWQFGGFKRQRVSLQTLF